MKTPTRRRRTALNPLDPAIFREAARRIAQEEDTYACCALDAASKDLVSWDESIRGNSPACRVFERLFRPKSNARIVWYAGVLDHPWKHSPEGEDNMARTLGLLLCATLLEEGAIDLPN